MSDAPDMTRPLSRFNAMYWAMTYRIAAALGATDWAVLCALYQHLPNIKVGTKSIAKMAGVSAASVKRARKQFERVGLMICTRPVSRDLKETIHYQAADIRHVSVASAIVERLKKDQKQGVSDRIQKCIRPDTRGVYMTPQGGL